MSRFFVHISCIPLSSANVLELRAHRVHRWSTWNANCSAAIYQSVYPETIPAGTSVPAWAYLDVSTSDNFNITAANQNKLQGHAESSASGPSATGSGAGSSPTSGPQSGSSKHSNTGAIVGGVVGGIGGAAIIAAIAFFFWRRHKRNVAAAGSGLSTDPNTFAPGVAFGGDEKQSQPYASYSNANIVSPIPVNSPSPAPGSNTAGVGAGYAPTKIYVSRPLLEHASCVYVA